MPRFEPFPGIRYDLDRVDLGAVAAPPYDVIDADERARLAARSPYNAVHVDCPVGDASCYEAAAAEFRRWRDDKILVTDSRPTLTVYRMAFTDESGRERHTTGVIGALGLERDGRGEPRQVLPHEHTTPKAKSDRLDLMRATRANLSAIWVLTMARGLSKLIEPTNPPAAAFTDDDGVRHEVWPVADPDFAVALSDVLGSAPVVIADGHHRYETSVVYASEQPGVPGADATLAYVVELVDDELTIGPIHRLVDGLPAGFDLGRALEPWFERREAVPDVDDLPARMEDEGALALVVPGGAWLLHVRPGAFDETIGLDTRRLDVALAALPPHELSFQHGAANALDAVTKGRAQAALLLRPVGVDQIGATVQAGERFPPKTTFFWPKPRTGLVFRSLE